MPDERDRDSYKRFVASSFDRTPPTYGTGGDFHQRFAERLVEPADPRPGQTVLDVATGTAPAAVAARRVGSGGRVLGVDISTGMLAHARRNIATAGLGNVAVGEGDAERLPFADRSFDVVLCSSAIAWLPRIPTALEEWNRVLVPGGRLAFSCLAEGALPLAALLRQELRAYGVDLPDMNEPLDTPEKCKAMVRSARFANVEVRTGQFGGYVRTAKEGWEKNWPGLADRLDVRLGSEEEERLKASFVAQAERLATDLGIWDDLTTLFVLAKKPAEFDRRPP